MEGMFAERVYSGNKELAGCKLVVLFSHRVDGLSKGTTCEARLGHDVVFFRRPERRVTKDVLHTSHIDRIQA